MTFAVPEIKEDKFSTDLFCLLSDCLFELKAEASKFPDKITFSGPLGKEIYFFIQEKKWDLQQFGIALVDSIVNKIIFEYSKSIDQIEDRGATIFDGEFNNKKINGLPGEKTIQKILAAYSSPLFKIERQIRPKLEVRLTREPSKS